MACESTCSSKLACSTTCSSKLACLACDSPWLTWFRGSSTALFILALLCVCMIAAKQKELIEQRALVIEEAHYGADHVEVAITKLNLGVATGSFEMVSEAYAAFLAHYGPEHPRAQTALRLKAELG